MRAHSSLRLGTLHGTTPELLASPGYCAWGFCMVWEVGSPTRRLLLPLNAGTAEPVRVSPPEAVAYLLELFQDAKTIADLLVEVMDRNTQELKDGKHQISSHTRASQRPKPIKKGLEELGEAKRLQAELQWLAERKQVRPGLRQLRPEDLPLGVKASRGYDHRGHCLTFEHNTLGELGKIVLINIREGRMLLQAELYKGPDDMPSPLLEKKKHVFEQIVTTVNNRFDENFPE